MIKKSHHIQQITTLVKNFGDDVEDSVSFLCEDGLVSVPRRPLVLLSPLVRAIVRGHDAPASDTLVTLPSFSSGDVAALARLVALSWSQEEDNTWTRTQLELFSLLHIEVSKYEQVNIEPFAAELEEVQENSKICEDENSESDSDLDSESDVDDEEDKDKYATISVKCNYENCDFHAVGVKREIAKTLKTHLGFEHHRLEFEVLVKETFQNEQCSFCGNSYGDRNRRLIHLLMKHDGLGDKLDDLVDQIISDSKNELKIANENTEVDKVTEDDSDDDFEISSMQNVGELKKLKKDVRIVLKQSPIPKPLKSYSPISRQSKRKRKIEDRGCEDFPTPSVKKCRVMLRREAIVNKRDDNETGLRFLGGKESNIKIHDVKSIGKSPKLMLKKIEELLETPPATPANGIKCDSDSPRLRLNENMYKDDIVVGKLRNLPNVQVTVESSEKFKQEKSSDLPLLVENPLFESTIQSKDHDVPRTSKEPKTNSELNKVKMVKLNMRSSPIQSQILARKNSPKSSPNFIDKISAEFNDKTSSSLRRPGKVSEQEQFNLEATPHRNINVIQESAQSQSDHQTIKSMNKATNDRQNVKNEKVLKEDVVVDEDDELATLAEHATVDSGPMTDIDDEIQRSLILDQDLSDDEDDLSEELVDTSSFVDARDSLMKELGIVDREIISIPS